MIKYNLPKIWGRIPSAVKGSILERKQNHNFIPDFRVTIAERTQKEEKATKNNLSVEGLLNPASWKRSLPWIQVISDISQALGQCLLLIQAVIPLSSFPGLLLKLDLQQECLTPKPNFNHVLISSYVELFQIYCFLIFLSLKKKVWFPASLRHNYYFWKCVGLNESSQLVYCMVILHHLF